MASVGSYATKLSRLLAPDKVGAVLILSYTGELREVARDSLRVSLLSTGCDGVFVGRIHLLTKSIPRSIPTEGRAIYDCIKPNSVIICGPDCAKWWSGALKTIKGLQIFQSGQVTFDSFFLGYHKLDVSFLEFFSDRVSIECKHASIYIPSTLSCLLDDDNPLHEMTEEANVTARLYDAILELWTESMSCLSIEAHRTVCQLLKRGRASFVLKVIDTNFKDLFRELRQQVLQMSLSKDILGLTTDVWHGGFIRHCKNFFSVMDSFIPDCVMMSGTKHFKAEMLSLEVGNMVLEMIFLDRSAFAINSSLIRNVTMMMMDLGVYTDLFERRFLDYIEMHYRWKVSQFPIDKVCKEVIHEVESSSIFLLGDSLDKLIVVLRRVILYNKTETFKGFLLCSDDKGEQLTEIGTIYKILAESFHSNQIVFCWITQCFDTCVSCLAEFRSSVKPVELISNIVLFVYNCQKAIDSYFLSSSVLLEYMLDRVHDLVNGDHGSYGNYMALFIDFKLRGTRDTEFDVTALDIAIAIVEFLENKEFFVVSYLSFLAKRLASPACDIHTERAILPKFDAAWSGNLNRISELMFNDVVESEVMMDAFTEKSSMSVKLFDSSISPLTGSSCAHLSNLPPEICHMIENFTSYYESLDCFGHKKKKLMWLTDYGHASLTGNFGGKKYTLQATTLQMLVLMLFNSTDRLTFDEIKGSTGIEPSKLRDTLVSLWKKNLLLSYETNGVPTFCINDNFCPHGAASTSVSSTEPEFLRTLSKVGASKKPAIEAAIVRIMKAKRKLLHADLIAEVVLQLSKYNLDPDQVYVKFCIEQLMRREYLERDTSNPELYHYVA